MPRYRLKDLLISTAIIAAGLVVFSAHWDYAVNRELKGPPPLGGPVICLFLWLGSGAFIGAGLLYPLKAAWIGAMVGVLVQMVLLVLIVRTIQF